MVLAAEKPQLLRAKEHDPQCARQINTRELPGDGQQNRGSLSIIVGPGDSGHRVIIDYKHHHS